MPESKRRKRTRSGATAVRSSEPKPNPVWYKPVMFGLMIVGLLWIITFYISEQRFPVEAWGSWNIMVGFGVAIVGFLMTTRWR
ncbi:cell division protein CrgA [Arthrobacter echini]|uniref:Cell division protein CrgA n=1 Tax=Arthrobacter echini TaxID=1529066 RepID=A0A4S5EAT5_9MICC|nr:cell division protein CrgA [Arthrobacter echini]THJ68720.1 cell division protein CrgA [Arthrobacter echini]